MIIKIPEGFDIERKYLLKIVFTDFFDLDYTIVLNSAPQYEIILENMNSIIIEDHFFCLFKDGLEYLGIRNIPEKVSFCSNPFTPENDIPVIYGVPGVQIIDNQPKVIRCKIDIFSSIFFMLTRWEEYVISSKDQFGRFPEELSLSVKNEIHFRPVVNEYVEMIWNMLVYSGFSGGRRRSEFEVALTHDIDEIIRFKSLPRLLRITAGDIVLRKKPALIPLSVSEYIQFRSGKIKDSYDTFDFLMDMSEKINIKSIFYFLPQKRKTNFNKSYANHDIRYDIQDPEVVSVIRNIVERGHTIGLHGSFNTFSDAGLFSYELKNLSEIAGNVTESRQHYLRFSPPITWEIASTNSITRDSTLGFNFEIGFRCGICNEFQVFNFLKREPLDLIEMPLSSMEAAVVGLSRDPDEFFSIICSQIDLIRKYNGKFVLLWHTNSFNTYNWLEYQKYYPLIIDYLR
jgi:hypothetical protein